MVAAETCVATLRRPVAGCKVSGLCQRSDIRAFPRKTVKLYHIASKTCKDGFQNFRVYCGVASRSFENYEIVEFIKEIRHLAASFNAGGGVPLV